MPGQKKDKPTTPAEQEQQPETEHEQRETETDDAALDALDEETDEMLEKNPIEFLKKKPQKGGE